MAARKRKQKKIKPVYVIDCETDPFSHGAEIRPFVWGCFDGVTFQTFRETKAMVAFLANGEEKIVYAHNGGKFDYHQPGFLDALMPGQKVMIINGRLAKFRIGNAEFRDSYNILPIALSEYKKDDIDYKKMDRKVRHLHMPEILKYLEGDCRYLYEIVMAFIGKYSQTLTLAGAAMKYWSATRAEGAPQTDSGFYKMLKPYYHGGRVQPFHMGRINEPFSMYDIKSAYPYAMLHQHPYSTVPIVENDPEIVEDQGFYDVHCISRGAFPYRTKDDGLTFPDDDAFRTYQVTGWELRAARETGTIVGERILKGIRFVYKTNFINYVTTFYDMKANAKKGSPEYIMAKLLLNSLYGKFGANPDEYSNFVVEDPAFARAAEEADGCCLAGSLGPWAILESPLYYMQKRFYHVGVAASITGFVRAYLWRAICALGRENVLYCDTDSIACKGTRDDSLTIGKELGNWEAEGRFVNGGIAGRKLYAFLSDKGAWKVASKGVRLSAEQILQVCDGQAVSYQKESPTYSVGQGMRYITRKVKMA
jgi:hypothetical protein